MDNPETLATSSVHNKQDENEQINKHNTEN